MQTQNPELSLQESVLAYAMLHRIGDATVQFAINGQGDRVHTLPSFTEEDFSQLSGNFAQDPKESLAWARESLFAISADKRLPKGEHRDRLSRYLDAYFNLTLRLDHSVFPNDSTVRQGMPSYIPDGFIDMGKYAYTDPDHREREQIWVDKRGIFEKYKLVLMDIFSSDYSEVPLKNKKAAVADTLAMRIRVQEMPAAEAGLTGDEYLGHGRVRLSELTEGVCRHQSLVFQVLSQAAGLTTRSLKGYIGYTRHATNALRIDGQWYLYDVPYPDYVTNASGQNKWRRNVHKIEGLPPEDGQLAFTARLPHSGEELSYILRGTADTYWFIDHPE